MWDDGLLRLTDLIGPIRRLQESPNACSAATSVEPRLAVERAVEWPLERGQGAQSRTFLCVDCPVSYSGELGGELVTDSNLEAADYEQAPTKIDSIPTTPIFIGR
jgi:hypothetical protein